MEAPDGYARFIGLFARTRYLNWLPTHEIWVSREEIIVGSGRLRGVRVQRSEVVRYEQLFFRRWMYFFMFFGGSPSDWTSWKFMPVRGRRLRTTLEELGWNVQRGRRLAIGSDGSAGTAHFEAAPPPPDA